MWLKVKSFRIERANPNIIKYRYSHSGDYFNINIQGKGRPSVPSTLENAYSGMLPIAKKKYEDLKKLCATKDIPIEFHAWYASLPTCNSVRNKNAEPSIDSDSESGEDD